MARPRNADPPHRINICIPLSLYQELTVFLFSPSQGEIPRGAISQFFEQGARLNLERLRKALANQEIQQ